MKEFESRVFDTIRLFHMIEEGDHVIAGVSGGADSVCLLNCLCSLRRQMDFSLTAVHVEHGIRGQESMEDAAFVEALCRQKGIACEVIHGDVPALAKKWSRSLEEAARDFRYSVFREKSEKTETKSDVSSGNGISPGVCRIAVAHNLGDQAETVLHNLVRGTGLQGLGGMRPVQGEIIRPLIRMTREEIEEYLVKAGIPWRTDRTNLETVYTRNRMRHLVMPQLTGMNARAREHICEAAGRAAAADAFLAEEAKRWCCGKIGTEKLRGNLITTLKLDDFETKAEILQEYILREALQAAVDQTLIVSDQASKEYDHALKVSGYGLKDVGSVHIRALMGLTGMPCGKTLDLPGRMKAWRADNMLCFRKGETAPASVQDPIYLTSADLPADGSEHCVLFGAYEAVFRVISRPVFDRMGIDYRQEKKYTKWLAYDTINEVLCLREEKPGDTICVNRDGSRKKWKRYMIDRKIPAQKRDGILLIADGNRILWAVGYRMASDAGIKEDTSMIVQIEIRCLNEDTIEQEEKGNG